MVQPITLCASTLKRISIHLVTAYKRKKKANKRKEKIYVGIIVCSYMYTVRVLNFVGKIFVFLVRKKIRGVLNFVAMAAW